MSAGEPVVKGEGVALSDMTFGASKALTIGI
jgi:hypothetical protein